MFSRMYKSLTSLTQEYGGCVSDALLFYGVENLSIVDASILPLIPTQHIQSTMYGVGEKAADMTVSSWPSRMLRHLRFSMFHILMCLSVALDATYLPSGDKATERIFPRLGTNVEMQAAL